LRDYNSKLQQSILDWTIKVTMVLPAYA